MISKHDKLILLHDNVELHAKKSYPNLSRSDLRNFPHSLFLPDITPSDYHLFRSGSRHVLENVTVLIQISKNVLMNESLVNNKKKLFPWGNLYVTQKMDKVVASNDEYHE